jgi:hypothetical protein
MREDDQPITRGLSDLEDVAHELLGERDPTEAEAAADDSEDKCSNPGGHSWVTADEDNGGDGRSYCQHCLADGDA